MRCGLILVVDDDSEVSDTTCTLLDFFGYDTITAKNGKEAINKFEESCPDIVLIDAKMPEMDGYQTIVQLKKQNSKSKLALITADPNYDKLKEMKKKYDFEVLEKPYSAESLKRLIQRLYSE